MTDNELIERMVEEDEGGWRYTTYDVPTFAGVTLDTFRGCFPDATEDTLMLADEDDIIRVYRERFLEPLKKCPRYLLPAVFSACVNLGLRGGVHVLQGALNRMSPTEEWIAADGIIGVKTHDAAVRLTARHGQDAVLAAFVMGWIKRYENICTYNVSKRQFLRGWMARARRHFPRRR